MRRTPVIAMLCAWLLASGVQWDLAQLFAWGRMTVAYSRTMSLREAVRLTFTPDNWCDVCRFVSAARGQGDGQSPDTPPPQDTAVAGKLLPVAATSVVVAPAHVTAWRVPPSAEGAHSHGRPEPPTEPPRAA